MSDPYNPRLQREPSFPITSSRAVGRIAEVVAAARASLQEPSRPHTPQTLDQRILSGNFSQNESRNLSSISHSTMQKKLLTRRRMEGLQISEALSLPLPQNIETPLSSRPSTSSSYNSSHNSSHSSSPRLEETDKLESTYSSSQINSQYENAIKSNLQELFEFLVSYENLLKDCDSNSETFNEFLNQLKSQFNQIYQKLRLINSKEQLFPSILHKIAITELSLIHSSLWKILNFVGDSYISWGVKAQIYILILRFLITSINKGENFATSSVTALSIQFLIKEFVDNKPGSRKTSTLDNSFNDEDDHGYNDLSREDLSEDTLESSIQQSILMDQLHLSIETFRFIFSCLEETLYYYYNNSLESCSPRIPYSSNYTELIISAQLLQNNSIDKILEIAYQTTAWVRSLILTNDNRRRAIYHGIAEVTLSTLRICCSIRLTNDNSNNNSSKVQSLIAQLLSLIRNIVNDKSGRDRFNDPNPAFFKKTRLSNSLNIISCLCLLLYRYKTHPVVVMSVVRVLAVMSQFEVFRTLIRASSSYLSEIVSQPSSSRTYDELNGIIGVIKYEADICKSIMEDNDENCEVTEWPSWYTWPVISRACYTLGNITMMNAKIRKVIGIKLDITSSLVLLLQVSANSLLRIHQQNQEKISLKNGNSIFTVVNKGNEVYNIGGVDTIFSFLARHVTENNRIHSLRKEEEESKKGSRRGDHDGNSSDYEIDDTSEMELRDAVIKLIRLLSNLSIDEQIGASVGVRQDLIQSLYELLLIAQNNNLPITTSNEYQYEELQLNIIAALTNLTFYTCQALNNKEDLVIKQQKEQQTKVVSKTLIRFDRLLTRLSVSLIDSIFHSNNEIVLEATRVLGNLTRRVAPIEALISRRVDEALLMISQVMINKLKASNPSNSFQSEDPSTIEYEIAQSCIGILVNFSALSDGRYKILSFPAPGSVRSLSIFEELLRFLKILSPFYHVSLAVLITQVIYNIISSLEFRKNYIKNYSEKISTPSLISAFYEDLPDNIKNIPNTLNEWVELGEEDLEGNINTSSEYKQLVQVSQAIDKLF